MAENQESTEQESTEIVPVPKEETAIASPLLPEQRPEHEQFKGLYEYIFQKFTDSQYDTSLLVLAHEACDNLRTSINPERKAGQVYHDYRLCLEYIIQRIPDKNHVLQELLLQRIKWTWEQQREESNNKFQQKEREEWFRFIQREIRGVKDFVLYNVLKRPLYYENGVPASGQQTKFGFIDENGVLFLESSIGLPELAQSLLFLYDHHRQEISFFTQSRTGSSITRQIKDSKKIVLLNKEFSSLESAIKRVQKQKAEETTHNEELTELLLSLLRNTRT